jgi:hypothetical protein
VFWDPIKKHVPPRSALFEAVYLEALLYLFEILDIFFAERKVVGIMQVRGFWSCEKVIF